MRLQRGAEHLHRLGPRATAELLAEVGARIGGMPFVLGLLAEYERRLTPAMLQVLEPPPVEKTLPELGTWRQTVARCLEHPGSLRRWEVGFLRDLPAFRRLSVKQRYVLKEIADRVLSRLHTRSAGWRLRERGFWPPPGLVIEWEEVELQAA